MLHSDPKPRPTPLIQIGPLPQLVPSRACFSCDVCCRFPDQDSFLRPYFTTEEIRRAVAAGVDPTHFPDLQGGQVRVVPNPSGEGYLCPAFDPATSRCGIYDVRPFDCQIYPLAMMWSADGGEVLLGWDTKCPFMPDTFSPGLAARASRREVEDYAERIAASLERDEILAMISKHPRLVGRFQDDVVILRALPRLTKRLLPVAPCLTPLAFHPLTLADRPRFEQAFAASETPLAAYAFAPHFMWQGLFSYSWTEVAGHLGLFAEYDDGLFMPLPPFPVSSPSSARGEEEGAFAEALGQAFAFMRASNKGTAVTRVENVPEELKPSCEALGYRVVPKDPDYLYRASDLGTLSGDRYKSQRAACNRFVRTQRYRMEPYRDGHRADCLALFDDWAAQKQEAGVDEIARHMLRDAASAHRNVLVHHCALGLVGSVISVDDEIRAYTFGFERSPSVFCVLLEVADRRIPGLAHFLFRETCRAAMGRGSVYVNSMDDSGLPALAQSKRAYHPVRLVANYIVTAP